MKMKEFPDDFRAFVKSLPPRLQKVISLRYEEGKTYREIGEQMRFSASWARELEHKALRKIRWMQKRLWNESIARAKLENSPHIIAEFTRLINNIDEEIGILKKLLNELQRTT